MRPASLAALTVVAVTPMPALAGVKIRWPGQRKALASFFVVLVVFVVQ